MINNENIFHEILRHQIYQKWFLIDQLAKNNPIQNIRTCPLCGHIDNTQNFKKYHSHCIFGGGELLRYGCPCCDVIFGPDKMFSLSEYELSEEYKFHYKTYQEGDSTELELKAFYALEPSKNGTYLNYGAGSWSKTVRQLRDEGWNVYAFEPHDTAAQSQEHMIKDWEKLYSMKFDGIFSNNVLEHLRHPIMELIRQAKLLTENGRIALATPCFEYLYEYTRFHLFFYTGKSRDLLIKKAGFEGVSYTDQGIFKCYVLTPRGK